MTERCEQHPNANSVCVDCMEQECTQRMRDMQHQLSSLRGAVLAYRSEYENPVPDLALRIVLRRQLFKALREDD